MEIREFGERECWWGFVLYFKRLANCQIGLKPLWLWSLWIGFCCLSLLLIFKIVLKIEVIIAIGGGVTDSQVPTNNIRPEINIACPVHMYFFLVHVVIWFVIISPL